MSARKVVPSRKPTPSRKQFNRAVGAILTPLPSPNRNPRNLDFAGLGVRLDTLFRSPCMQTFGCYFYLNTIRWNPLLDPATGAKLREGFEDAAGEGIANPGVWPFHRQADPASVILNVQFMTGISGQAAFNNSQLRKMLPAVFVRLDNLNCFVPFDMAALISTCFIDGLVSRLILGNYVPIWKKYAPNNTLPIAFEDLSPAPGPGAAPPGATPAANMDKWIASQITQFANNCALTTTWNGNPMDATLYGECVSQQTNPSLQLAGIMMGWRAGDALSAAAGTPDGTAALNAVWQFLGYRHTTEDLGKMMGYAFMFLSGFMDNDRTGIVVNFKPTSALPTPPQLALSPLFVNFTVQMLLNRNSNKVSLFRGLIDRFYRLIEGELYGITQNSNFPGPGTANQALINYNAFIGGFVHGMTTAADQLFDELYNVGYQTGYENGLQIGFTNGFRDGYSQGFTGGYTVGYQNGDAAGYAAGASSVGGLGSIISGISNVLGSTSSILSDAGTVGTVISTIAGLF